MSSNLLKWFHSKVKWQIAAPVTVAFMALLIAFVYIFKIPNPNMILIAGLVVCSALFGYRGGIPAGVIMLAYTLYFFSTNNDFVTFSSENVRKVFVSFIGIVVDMFFVCSLKNVSYSFVQQIKSLTERLQEDNRLLQEISLRDPLTGCRNRFSLRHDFPAYINRCVYTIMLDVDDFKSINDEFGHDEGDKALEMTGKLLTDTFGEEHCYRYGGDEFLLICPDMDQTEFTSKIEAVMNNRPVIRDNQINYSVGYAHGTAQDESTLRNLFILADQKMYQAKRSGKNKIVGV